LKPFLRDNIGEFLSFFLVMLAVTVLKLPPLSPSCFRMFPNILACCGPLFLTAVTFHHSLMSAVTVHHSLMTAVTVIVL